MKYFCKYICLLFLILFLPFINTAWAQFNPSDLSRIRLSIANGGDYMPGLDATSSGNSLGYIIDNFGIGYTQSSLVKKDSSNIQEKLTTTTLDLSVMTGVDKFSFQAGYGWLLSHKWAHETKDTITNSSEGGAGFFNAGINMGFLEFFTGYRVWSVAYTINKSWKRSNGSTTSSDEKGQLAYKEMYLGLGYIF